MENSAKRSRRSVVVGVAGGSGSGKTTISQELVDHLPSCALISTDRYYQSLEHLPVQQRDQINFDHPQALDEGLLSYHLSQLRQGSAVDLPSYCFETHTRLGTTERLRPPECVILEGILVLAVAEIRDQVDVSVFVEASSKTRYERRLHRDVESRGRSAASVRRQWETSVEKMHREFVEPSRAYADITVSTEPPQAFDFAVLLEQVRARLE